MRRGALLAEELAGRVGRDPWVVAERLGVSVLEGPLVGRVSELYIEDESGPVIVVAAGLSRVRACEALAYGLGHHVLARDARRRGRRPPRSGRAHRAEVEAFAAHLLISPQMMREALLRAPVSLDRWASEWGVSRRLVARRLGAAEKGG